MHVTVDPGVDRHDHSQHCIRTTCKGCNSEEFGSVGKPEWDEALDPGFRGPKLFFFLPGRLGVDRDRFFPPPSSSFVTI